MKTSAEQIATHAMFAKSPDCSPISWVSADTASGTAARSTATIATAIVAMITVFLKLILCLICLIKSDKRAYSSIVFKQFCIIRI